jgi:hypothetical protein
MSPVNTASFKIKQSEETIVTAKNVEEKELIAVVQNVNKCNHYGKQYIGSKI